MVCDVDNIDGNGRIESVVVIQPVISKVNRKLKCKIFEHYDDEEDFARVLGVSSGYVKQVIKMKRVPCAADRVVWGELLDTTPEYLWGRGVNSTDDVKQVRTVIGVIRV